MVTLFLGLSAGNLLLLGTVFALGLGAVSAGKPTGLYPYHFLLALGAGLFATLTHVSVVTYFMATAKWLQAATEKANFDPMQFLAPALRNKRRNMPIAMTAVLVTIVTMFAGAGADPMRRPLWAPEVHLGLAIAAILANLICAMAEYRLIRAQGQLMDAALARLNQTPGPRIEPV